MSTLRDEHPMLMAALEAASGPMFVLDDAGVIVQSNAAACSLIGVRSSQLCGSALTDWAPPQQPAGQNSEELLKLHVENGLANQSAEFPWVCRTNAGGLLPTRLKLVDCHTTEQRRILASVLESDSSEATRDAYTQREEIYRSVSRAASGLLRASDWRNAADELLRDLGEATNASRSYIVQFDTDEQARVTVRPRFEWAADGVSSQLHEDVWQGFPVTDSGFEPALETMRQGTPVYGEVGDFPESVHWVFERRETRSLIFLPILNQQQLWGFVGFDDCWQPRNWPPMVIEALQSAANTLGAAIERRQRESALARSEAQFRQIFNNEPGCVKLMGSAGELIDMNPAGLQMIEANSIDEIRGICVYDLVCDEYRDRFATACEAVFRGESRQLEFEIIGLKGTRRWMDTQKVPLFDERGNVTSLLAITRDISERKRIEQNREGQNRVLKLLALDAQLEDVLDPLLASIEQQSNGMLCSVLLMSDDGLRLQHGAAPSLPSDYCQQIDGMEIGPRAGACGAAAHQNCRIIVEDTIQDPLWEAYRDFARKYDLRACWSQPIHARDGKVLGTFAMYYHKARRPSAAEIRLIENAAYLAGIAIERRKTDAEMARQRRELQAILDALQAQVYYLDTNARAIRHNRYSQMVTGQSDLEIRGADITSYAPFWDDPQRRHQEALEVARTGRPMVGSIETYEIDQEKRWATVDRVPVYSADGDVSGVLQFIYDITHLKRIEQALRLTKFALENAADPMLTVGPDGMVLNANRTACDHFGYSQEELVGKKVIEFSTRFDEQSWELFWRSLRRKGRRLVETQHITKHGDRRDVEVSIAYFEFEGEYCCASIRDVTDSKQQQEQLCLTQFTVDQSIVEIYWIAEDGRFLYVNQAAADSLKYPLDDLRRQTIFDIQTSMTPSAWAAFWRQLQQSQQNFEAIHEGQGEHQYPAQVSASLIRYKDRDFAVLYARDITAKKLTEETLQRSRDELAHVSRVSTMGEMATGIAHELNQPLAAIANLAYATEAALGRSDLDISWLKEKANTICEQSVRAGDIVRRLRSFVKRAGTKRMDTDIGDIVDDCLKMLDPELRTHGIQLQQSRIDIGKVHVDAIQIQQVLVNLVRNAVEALKEVDRSARELQLSIEQPDAHYVAVVVHDNGPGISETQRSSLFEPFFSTKDDGMGLGLAISRSIIEDHGGKLMLESTNSSGATFRLLLPVVQIDESSDR